MTEPIPWPVAQGLDLVLFDLDGTLLEGDSELAWTGFLAANGFLDAHTQAARDRAFARAYARGELDTSRFLDFHLAPVLALRHHSRAHLDALNHRFLAETVRPMIKPQAAATVRQHLDNGAMVALVTATNSFISGPIARELGIHHLVATVLEQDDRGSFSGRNRGIPAFRDGKIERVDAWLESLGLHGGSFDNTWFYSDSHNDLPLMQRVTRAVAVDPDATLRAHAAGCGWPIISLR
ncbi:HAD family phosphatase [Azoarcus sp. L1K30]|uniref:HAD family hydrolase n=1 Tax=Azoarcus sp. L1K30 TaxID=2820277 RepID=UPI001B829144|nr:HAD family phosphatase [Azoarcus sp. L1K30]MBR0568491.1 HAD family phosphatase [Azoarcus sp. L1K30]